MWLFEFVLTILLALAPLDAARQTEPAPARFDYQVRTDFFAGFAGDAARLRRAMEICERVLNENPRHAEALVWHGAGLMAQAGQLLAAGDRTRGMELWERALGEMNAAVALEPDNLGVIIPRAAVLLQATRRMPAEPARPLLQQALADYEKALAIQTPYFQTLGAHPRGELLFGLAEGYGRLGQMDKARHYFNRIVTDAADSGHAATAREFLANGTMPQVTGAGCVGCHKQ